MKRVLGVPVV
jgi:hypothetical protein